MTRRTIGVIMTFAFCLLVASLTADAQRRGKIPKDEK